MGLDYLNKKVWHPGSMKNIQKVWEVEQKQKEINKRTREREKKLLEEQHNEELKRIQVEAGLIPRSHLDRMEWMYDWGNKINQQQKTKEEFLTGKKAAGDREGKHVFQQQITNNKCEDFQLLHEDPMYEIMRKEKQRRDAIVNNPLQMRNIIKEVQRQYLPHDLEERRHQHRSSKRQRSPSSSSSSSSDSSSRGKDRSRSRDRKHKSKDKKSSFKQSDLYKNYLKQRFGSILKKGDDDNLVPNYSIHKKKYRTQYQIDEDERRRRLQQLRDNAKKLQQMKGSSENKKEESDDERNYEQGVANIRKNMLQGVKENRNHRKYKHSDSD